jgi:hypothetical protein
MLPSFCTIRLKSGVKVVKMAKGAKGNNVHTTDNRQPTTDYQLPITDSRLPHTAYRIPHSAFRIPGYRKPVTA